MQRGCGIAWVLRGKQKVQVLVGLCRLWPVRTLQSLSTGRGCLGGKTLDSVLGTLEPLVPLMSLAHGSGCRGRIADLKSCRGVQQCNVVCWKTAPHCHPGKSLREASRHSVSKNAENLACLRTYQGAEPWYLVYKVY